MMSHEKQSGLLENLYVQHPFQKKFSYFFVIN